MTTNIFKAPTGLISYVNLTDANGVELEYVSDAPGFYKLAGEDIDQLSFYIDHDGTKWMDILTISVCASDSVPLEADYIWNVGGIEKIKTLYDDKIETLDASIECPTAYPGGEPIPYGTPHYVRVDVGEADSGTYEVYVCVMARMGTVVEEDESEDIPDNLDVTFAGITLSAISEPDPVYDIPFNETILASGQNYIQANTVVKFSRTYLCAPATYAERQAIIAKLGVSADLIIDGTTYSGCYIKPPLSFSQLIPGKYAYTINFVQHSSPM